MIEIGEVVSLGIQIDEVLRGKRIDACARGNAPHKWAFYNPEFDSRAPGVSGALLEGASGSGKCVYVAIEGGRRMMLGEIGGRVAYHAPGSSLPAKHHFAMTFADGSALSVAVQGWGFFALLDHGEVAPEWAASGEDPLAPEFTLDRFLTIWHEHPERAKATLKAFLVSKPRIAGIGNGYAQEILFNARLRPARLMRDVSASEAADLYAAVCSTVQTAVGLRGRDTERDLHGNPGGYVVSVDRRASTAPCRRCGGSVVGLKLLGGTSYFCEGCQR